MASNSSDNEYPTDEPSPLFSHMEDGDSITPTSPITESSLLSSPTGPLVPTNQTTEISLCSSHTEDEDSTTPVDPTAEPSSPSSPTKLPVPTDPNTEPSSPTRSTRPPALREEFYYPFPYATMIHETNHLLEYHRILRALPSTEDSDTPFMMTSIVQEDRNTVRQNVCSIYAKVQLIYAGFMLVLATYGAVTLVMRLIGMVLGSGAGTDFDHTKRAYVVTPGQLNCSLMLHHLQTGALVLAKFQDMLVLGPAEIQGIQFALFCLIVCLIASAVTQNNDGELIADSTEKFTEAYYNKKDDDKRREERWEARETRECEENLV